MQQQLHESQGMQAFEVRQDVLQKVHGAYMPALAQQKILLAVNESSGNYPARHVI